MPTAKRAYAAGTKIAVSQTEGEIKKLLRRAGADNIALAEGGGKATVLFELADRRFIMHLPLPDRMSKDFTHGYPAKGSRAYKRPLSETQADDRWEQACRQKWRALLLCIKAKVEGVEAGVETIEQAFFAHLVLPSGETISEWAERDENRSQLSAGRMPPLLGGPA